jgi:uncharacterized protein
LKENDTKALIDRCGYDYVSRRLQIQVEHVADVLGPGVGGFHFENVDWLLEVFAWVIKRSGAWSRGTRNIRNQVIVENKVILPRLPNPFEGFRILHLSDLHLDVFQGMGAHLGKICSSLEFDVALITGDFRFHTHSDYYPVFQEAEELVESLKCPHGVYGVLGNHDFLEFVPQLESRGIRVLLNESMELEKDGESIWVVGLDDAHFYGAHDFKKGFESVPEKDAKILMIHSPEVLEEAHRFQVDFIISGHTHAGQVCLPGGIPLWLNASCPRKYCRGAWNYKGIPGYTSSGAGSSGLPIRFNCPPEITLHSLQKHGAE